MEEKKAPQPITRAEFEAGVKFFYNNNSSFYFFKTIGVNVSIITDRWNNYYASVRDIKNDGFNYATSIFGKVVRGKVLFKNCMKSEINKSQD